MADRRGTFGPVVLLGLASAGLAAVAGHQPWLDLTSGQTDPAAWREMLDGMGLSVGEAPLAGALALVALAGWGVLLVTRGIVRRLVAALAALAGIGVVATWAVVGPGLADDASATLARAGFPGGVDSEPTLWFWAAPIAGGLSALAALLAVRLAPQWPEMGRRYDAPAAAGVPEAVDPQTLDGEHSLDLWKAIDAGQDPTERAPREGSE